MIVLAATLVYFPAVIRVVRAGASSAVGLDYVTAGRTRAERPAAHHAPGDPAQCAGRRAGGIRYARLLDHAAGQLVVRPEFRANPPTPDRA